jgi:hypothetical protein
LRQPGQVGFIYIPELASMMIYHKEEMILPRIGGDVYGSCADVAWVAFDVTDSLGYMGQKVD